MKEIYLDIMEKALSAYTKEHIQDYIDEVSRDGLSEHGFPRLGANIGILMAHGRCLEFKNMFIDIIELCLAGFAHPINSSKAGNNFAVREVCCALMELEKTTVIDREQLEAWKAKLAALDIPTVYTHIVSKENPTPGNWAYFAVVSEQARGLLCGIDSTEFLEHQLPSQLMRLDENGMYKDNGNFEAPYQPVVYDIVTRNLIGLSLFWGYHGKYAPEIESMMENSDELTLKMQSVTGELAFGGRSNQCVHNEMLLANYYELRATLLNKKGNIEKAGKFKEAARKATETAMRWLNQKTMSHIKNCFAPELQLGCERYAYFNKYMITVASNSYLSYIVADDSIESAMSVADVGYIAETGEAFHKVFMNAGGYFLEFDCNADTHYDANGLGRVHKKNCDSRICLSVPFPSEISQYKLETPNEHPLSICGLKKTADGIICSAEGGMKHILKSKSESETEVSAAFDCRFNDEQLFTTECTVNDRGVEIEFRGADGILLPAFLFDGVTETEITVSSGQIVVKYNEDCCKYTFSGEPLEYGVFFNRNGRYRVYKVNTDKLHIEISDINEL